MNRRIITDKIVVAKTGKTMKEWFKILDKNGAKKMNHIEIYHLVDNINGLKALGQWNQNLLSTTYEWERGLKEPGQRDKGFEVSVSKSISASAGRLYNSWIDDVIRSKWLPETKIKTGKTTKNKSLVLKWTEDTAVRVELYRKSNDKTQVVVQHMKIPDSKMSENMRIFWKDSLEKLKKSLEN